FVGVLRPLPRRRQPLDILVLVQEFEVLERDRTSFIVDLVINGKRRAGPTGELALDFVRAELRCQRDIERHVRWVGLAYGADEPVVLQPKYGFASQEVRGRAVDVE